MIQQLNLVETLDGKKNKIPQLFNDEIAKINVGEITKPFKSPNGFHILKINEKKGMKKKKYI